jgi:DNA-binding transcriptional regulator LsrR (DeoR family)
MVSIKLKLPLEEDLQTELISKDDMIDAVVVPSYHQLAPEEEISLEVTVGEAAARYLEEVPRSPLRSGAKMGLTCGVTLMETLLALSRGHFEQLDISTLTVESIPELAYQAPSTLAGILYAKYFKGSTVYAPQLTRTDNKFRSMGKILSAIQKEIEEHAHNLDLALVGIGNLDFHIRSRPYFEISRSAGIEPDKLKKLEAVGEIGNRPYDKKGEDIFKKICRSKSPLISMDLAFYKRMAKTKPVIAVAGGLQKVRAIRTALEQRFVNILITDLQTAQALLTGVSPDSES